MENNKNNKNSKKSLFWYIQVMVLILLVILGCIISDNQSFTFLRVLQEEKVNSQDITKVLVYLSYSLDRKKLGNSPEERFYYARQKLLEKQPGLLKYLKNLRIRDSNEDMALLIDEINKRQFVVIRGTNLKNYKDLLEDAQIIPGIIPNRFKKVKEFLTDIPDTYQLLHGYETIVTGHSLGGTLAMLTCGIFEWVDSCFIYNPGTSSLITNLQGEIQYLRLIMKARKLIFKLNVVHIGIDLFASTVNLIQRKRLQLEKVDDPNIFIEKTEGDIISQYGYLFQDEDGMKVSIQKRPQIALDCGTLAHSSFNVISSLPEFNPQECLKDFFKREEISQEEMISIYKEMLQKKEFYFEDMKLASNCTEGQYLGEEGCLNCKDSYAECKQGTFTPSCNPPLNSTNTTYFFNIKQEKCQHCDEGHYFSGQAQLNLCSKCPFHTKLQDFGHCRPLNCDKYSEYAHENRCFPCEDDSYLCDGIFRSKCYQGLKPDGENQKCIPCKSNEYGNYSSEKKNWACYPCPIGYKCNGITNQLCPQGTHSSTNEGQCLPCKANQYSYLSQGIYLCSDCPIGHQCDGTTSTKCQQGFQGKEGQCVPCQSTQQGIFDKEQGIHICQDCEPGYQCNGITSSLCIIGTEGQNGTCSPCNKDSYGHYSSSQGGINICSPCPEGYECNGRIKIQCPQGTQGKNSKCEPCKANEQGIFSSSHGFHICEQCAQESCKFKGCPQGTKRAGGGVCQACKSSEYGYFYSRFGGRYQCNKCPLDSRCDGKRVYLCKQGQYGFDGECKNCSDNEYGYYDTSIRRLRCGRCRTGYMCNGVSIIQCQQGTYGTEGICHPCRADQYGIYDTFLGIYKCQNCQKGYQCNGIERSQCPLGTEGLNGKCIPCRTNQTGQYQSFLKTYRCINCQVGKKCNGIVQSQCSQGFYGQDGECIPCQEDQYSFQQSSSDFDFDFKCAECPEGYECNGMIRVLCKQGFYGRSGKCIRCQEQQYGYLSSNGSIYRCRDCEKGYACDGVYRYLCLRGTQGIQGICIPCKPSQYGKISTFGGIAKCVDCPRGYKCNGRDKYIN